MDNTSWFSVKISFHILLTIKLLYSVTSGSKLTILHTNDVHSEFEQFNEFGLPCTKDDLTNSQCFGGIARRFSAVREARENNENVLFVDAGDAFQGTAWFDLYQGNATAHFMNYLGYDAMVRYVYFMGCFWVVVGEPQARRGEMGRGGGGGGKDNPIINEPLFFALFMFLQLYC